MTIARVTSRRTRLEKQRENVIADLLGHMTQEQVAAKYGVAPGSVQKFKVRHADKLTELSLAVEARVEDYAIASKVNRIAALQDRWDRMKALLDARAKDSRYSDEPGYETGLMIHQLKAIGRGEDFQLVNLYVTDAQLLAEMRATERAVAEELGSLPKQDITLNVQNNILQLTWGEQAEPLDEQPVIIDAKD